MKRLSIVLTMLATVKLAALSLSVPSSGAQEIIERNRYKETVARVRQGNELCAQEKKFLSYRTPKVKRALEKLLGRSLDGKYIPNISFCFSGGGVLAIACTLGFLLGAETTGLLDATTYISCLSCSTLAIASWLTNYMPMSKFIDYYLPNLAIGFYKKFDYEDVKQLLNVWQVKQLFGQSISVTDLFGGFTAYTCFESKKELCHQVYLSDQRRLVKKGAVPCPIYTMVSGETDREMVWYECTPWEIGSADFGTYVPSWAFGRTFNNGVSINNAPEQSLGYLLGLFNSVWAATLKETYDHAFFELLPHYKTRSIQTMWQQMISMRLVKSELPNFTYQLTHSPLKNQYHMQFVDAGVAFDMPYPPISGARAERAADVIIFCNVSVPVKELSRFDEAQRYAAQHGVQLPQLYTEGINNSVVTVFEDNHACNVPTVVYMPRIFDEKLWQKNRWRKECAPYRGMLDNFDLSTLNVINTTCVHPKNFAVPEEDSRRLVAMVQFNMQMSMPAIIAAINNVIDKHAAA